MVRLNIDGKEIETEAGKTVLQAALENNIYIPYFCYHPGLRASGNCRMCLVETENSGKPIASCISPVAENMVIKTNSEKIREIRKGILELILLNHPVDCPICDKAGECMLQDNYFAHSGRPSVFKEKKIKREKLISFSERITYDAERCILCSRCVRFTEDISKTFKLGVKNREAHSEICTADNESFRDIYSDNVIDICPVGALQSKYFRFDSRVWYLKKTKSICALCSRGCNIQLHSRDNRIRRVIPDYNPAVNGYWMCNYGRDINTYLNRERLSEIIVHGRKESLIRALEAIKEIATDTNPERIALLSSSFGSNDEIKLFNQLARHALKAKYLFIKDDFHEERECHTLDKMPIKEDPLLIRNDKNPNIKGNRIFLENPSDLSLFFELIKSGSIDLLIIWGEGFSFLSERANLKEAVHSIKHKILFSPFKEAISAEADIIVPVAVYSEKNGSFTNFNGQQGVFCKALEKEHECFEETELFKNLIEIFMRQN